MLLPLVFALAAPPTFVQAVEARVAATKMHLVDWWADDLDGDKTPEAIALVCSDDAGTYLVQRGGDLLEAPAQIDGRNSCPEAGAAPPAWHVEHAGVIVESFNVHHGHIAYSVAIRDGKLALVREDDDGIDVSSTGTTREEEHVDYDKLTWSQRVEPPHGRAKTTSGPLVVITDRERRASKLVGKSTLAATRTDSGMTLHVHADRALLVRDCSDSPCKTTRLAAGDSELTTEALGELELVAGRTTIHVKLQPLDGDATYPPAPPAS